MDLETLAKLATPTGIAVLLGWLLARVISRVGSEMIASIRAMGDAFQEHTRADVGAIQELTKALHEHLAHTLERLARIEGKLDGAMDERERTPVGVPIPHLGSEDDTPPLRHMRASTPGRGVPVGTYRITKRKDEDQ